MGVAMARTKLSAYAFGAFWAGLVGVIFAARNTYINPNSFTFMESAIVLSIVVLGGMGSIVGVIIAALVLILMPEYLRAFRLEAGRGRVFGSFDQQAAAKVCVIRRGLLSQLKTVEPVPWFQTTSPPRLSLPESSSPSGDHASR